MRGRILKGVAGVYDVSAENERFACQARGLFRKSGITPVAGDYVMLSNVDTVKKTAYLDEILPRSSELIRPRAANVDQAMLVFSIADPNLNYAVLDSMLVYMTRTLGAGRTVICVTKQDLTAPDAFEKIAGIYNPAGFEVLGVSAKDGKGLDSVFSRLTGKTTVLAGPSGVGKSSLLNALFPGLGLATGEISKRISRGKNTTRVCELFEVGQNSFIADTPGFTSFDAGLKSMLKPELQDCYPEFAPFLGDCFYVDCLHVTEHDCAVKARVGKEIPAERYESYVRILETLKETEY